MIGSATSHETVRMEQIVLTAITVVFKTQTDGVLMQVSIAATKSAEETNST
jgi:hypothetical protein